MTPPQGLRARPGWLAILLLALIVLALHLAALDWFGNAFQPMAAASLPEPIYTQLLQPTTTPTPAQKRAAAPMPTPQAPRRAPAPRPAPEQALPQNPAPPAPNLLPPPVETAAASVPVPAPIASASPTTAASASTIPSLARSLGDEPVVGNLSRPGGPAQNVASATPPHAPATTPASEASAPTTATAASAWPPSTKLSYTISGYWRGALHGSGALVWTVDGDRYDATLSGSAHISFSYQSTGRIDGDWLAPARYTERVFTREKSVTFDRASNTLHFSAIPDVLPLPPHAQDSASLFLQLANRLTTHPGDVHPGATLTFAVARPSGMTDWAFTIAGMDTVSTPAGPLQCWHVVRQATQANELGAQIWLSPQLQNLPVQIRLQQSADSFLLFTLDHAEQATPSAPASTAP
ncbi:MAG: DUF3108 domain-containing protein [Thiomonas sp.]|nr:DUF3108 domain-containing protein [Thiomonas sp.]